MSVLITTPQGILDHPNNTSQAKALYSFPKDERFKLKAALNQNSGYNLPSSFLLTNPSTL
jgi:hypothetical protein